MTDRLDPEAVHSRESFVAFLRELSERIPTDSTIAANGTLETFFAAASGWAADMDGFFRNKGQDVPTEPSWQLFAQIIAAGLIYE
jgi:hypothetical protein